MAKENTSAFNRIDGITLLLYFMLVAIGLLSVFSVEYRSTDPNLFAMSKGFMKQFMFFGIALFVGVIIFFTDNKFFSSFAYLFYAIGIFLLIITIFLGKDVKGSHSWLGVGGFAFQPGEVSKIFTALALSKFLSSPDTNFKTLKHRLIGTGLALLPCAIIILQDETGLALVYFSFFLVMYREGLPNIVMIIAISIIVLTLASLLIDKIILLYIILGLTLIAAYIIRHALKRDMGVRIILIGIFSICILFSQVAVPFVFTHVMKGYQVDRIYSMIGREVPDDYQSKTTDGGKKKSGNASDYNVTQSKIAIGSGGLLGKGFLNGTSTKNDFVPEQNTDFIFCAVGEQFGFVGSIILIGIYVSLLFRIMFLAERQRSAFSRIYGYCVASIFFFHFAINLSMTIGLAPVIGITLPLLSYGGSSLLSFSILLFILLRLDVDRQAMIR